MRKLGMWLTAALAAMIVGCVEAEPDRTNVVIDRDTTPESSTTIVHDSDPPAAAPDTDVDINVDTTDDTPDVVID
jgi:hypothetical protein